MEFFCDNNGTIDSFNAFDGAKFDFRCGVRLEVPNSCRARHFKLINLDTMQVLREFDAIPEEEKENVRETREKMKKGFSFIGMRGKEYNLAPEDSMVFNSFEDHQFIPWRIEQYEDDRLVFSYDLNIEGMRVLIRFANGAAIGDSIAWFQSMIDFQKKWDLDLHVVLNNKVAEIFKDNYSWITFHPTEEEISMNFPVIYQIGLVYGTSNESYVFRNFFDPYVMMRKIGCLTLNVPESNKRPVPKFPIERLIEGKYVCISSLSSSRQKNWNFPDGWNKVCEWLKEEGYRVIDIDKCERSIYDDSQDYIPDEAENWTGDMPLSQRLQLIYNAELFIGLGSGLSWLAWLVDTPKLIVVGATLEHTEIYGDDCSFIVDYQKCRGCITHHPFEGKNFGCKYKNSGRAYECTKSITPEMVINQIKKILKLG